MYWRKITSSFYTNCTRYLHSGCCSRSHEIWHCPGNTATFFWPIGDRTNGVPLCFIHPQHPSLELVPLFTGMRERSISLRWTYKGIKNCNTVQCLMPVSPERPVHVKRRPSGRRLSNDQGDRNENGKTSNRFRLEKQQLCTSSKPFFAHFFAVFARLKSWNSLIAYFMEEVKTNKDFLFFSLNLDVVL